MSPSFVPLVSRAGAQALRLPTVSRCWHLSSPDGAAGLREGDMAVPALRGPGDVLVRVRAASINPLDSAMARGYGRVALGGLRAAARELYSCSSPGPLVLGRDFSGEVVAVGRGVAGLQPGDAVWGAVHPASTGCHAQYWVGNQACLGPAPHNLSWTEAASIPYAGLTAWAALRAGLASGTGKAVVLGAGGGVGRLALQLLARHHGWEVIAVAREDCRAEVEAAGAVRLLDYTAPDHAVQLAGLPPQDLVLDCAGLGETSFYLKRLLRPRGNLVTLTSPVLANTDRLGILPGAAASLASLATLNLPLLPSATSLRWAFFTTDRPALEQLRELAESGLLRPAVTRVFPFCQMVEAFREAERGHSRGKIVVEMSDPWWSDGGEEAGAADEESVEEVTFVDSKMGMIGNQANTAALRTDGNSDDEIQIIDIKETRQTILEKYEFVPVQQENHQEFGEEESQQSPNSCIIHEPEESQHKEFVPIARTESINTMGLNEINNKNKTDNLKRINISISESAKKKVKNMNITISVVSDDKGERRISNESSSRSVVCVDSSSDDATEMKEGTNDSATQEYSQKIGDVKKGCNDSPIRSPPSTSERAVRKTSSSSEPESEERYIIKTGKRKKRDSSRKFFNKRLKSNSGSSSQMFSTKSTSELYVENLRKQPKSVLDEEISDKQEKASSSLSVQVCDSDSISASDWWRSGKEDRQFDQLVEARLGISRPAQSGSAQTSPDQKSLPAKMSKVKKSVDAFLKTCADILPSAEYPAVSKKISKYLVNLHPLCVNNWSLEHFLLSKSKVLASDHQNVYVHVKDVLDEMKSYKNDTGTGSEFSDFSSPKKSLSISTKREKTDFESFERILNKSPKHQWKDLGEKNKNTSNSASSNLFASLNLRPKKDNLEKKRVGFSSQPLPNVKKFPAQSGSFNENLVGRESPEDSAGSEDETKQTADSEDEEPRQSGKKNASEKHLLKLQNALKACADEIKRCEESPIDWDNDDESNFIMAGKLKDRYMKIYSKLAEYEGVPSSLKRSCDKKFTFSESKYKAINQKIEKFVNRNKMFPDFFDIKKEIEEVNNKLKLNLNDRQIHMEAERIFVAVGKKLKRRRNKDEGAVMYSYLKPDDEDPAANNSELDKKLEELGRVAKARIDRVFDRFVEKQASGGRSGTESDLSDDCSASASAACSESDSDSDAILSDETYVEDEDSEEEVEAEIEDEQKEEWVQSPETRMSTGSVEDLLDESD